MLRLGLALAVLLSASISVQAEGIEASVQPPTRPVHPESESIPFVLSVTVPCSDVLTSTSPTEQSAFVSVDFTTQNGVVITGPLTIRFPTEDCTAATESTQSQAYEATVPRTAPGLRALGIVARVALTNQTGQSTAGPTEASVPFTVTAEYYSVSQVKVPSKLKACNAPCTLEYELGVTNHGNARTQYLFEVVSKPGGDWNAQPPEILLVDSPNSGQGSNVGVVTFKVGVPTGGGEGAYSVIVKPSAADDPSKTGNPLTVNVLARDTGIVSKVTPGPGPLLPLALVGMALVLRRRA